MKIGLVSPFMPHDLADLLDPACENDLACIRGVLSTPVTPMVREWHRKGHDLSIFCLDLSVSHPYHLQGERLSIHVLPRRRSRNCFADFYREECRLIRQAVEREAPEVLSAQWTYEHAWAALQCGIPTAVTCHDSPLRYAWIAKHWFMTYQLAVAWRVIRKAERLICVSPYTARHIQSYFRPRCPVDVIPNGLLPEVFLRGKRRLEANAPRNGAFVFCSIGNWGGLKNVPTLLKAFSKVRLGPKPATLVLFGPRLGPQEEAEQWARRRGLHHGVVFKGSAPRAAIFDFLETEADLMVHPSLIETHGMVLIEAMACGVPVVGGRQSGAVPWTLEEGRCGYLCDIRDKNVLAETMLAAMNQPDGNRAMVERAWNSTRQRFLMETAANANEAVLTGLLPASKGTR